MGDRANVCVKEDSKDKGVFLYTHWGGAELPRDLQIALTKRWRWTDPQYLTRIIFDVMTEGQHGVETGYGIGTSCGDGEDRVLELDVEEQTVSRGGRVWTFEEYVNLTQEQIGHVWTP